jgi:large subunit ribosomal protein L24
MSKWIRQGDRVRVMTGNSKGLSGKVLSRKGERVLVEGINIRKKHMRRTEGSQAGRIVEMEMPIHVSNVCICDKENRPIRLRTSQEQNSQRSLTFREGTKHAVYRSVKKPA